MKEEDLLRFEWIADPQISPDGSKIAFTRVSVDTEADEYRTHLWLQEVPAAGQAPAPPRALTFGGRDGQPRWSPDGSQLAFVRRANAEADPQIHVLPLAGGEARALTSLKSGCTSPAWSPDGRRIAFQSGHNPALDTPDSKKPKHEPARLVTQPVFRWNNAGFIDWDHLDHVWVIDAAGGTPRALTTGRAFKEENVAWSRDGKWVLFTSDRRAEPWFGPEDNEIWAVSPELETPTEGDALRVVADVRGPLMQFAEGADGRIAAAGGVRPETYRSYDQTELLVFSGTWPMTEPVIASAKLDRPFNEGGISSDQHPPRGGGSQPLAFTADGRGVIGVIDSHGAGRLAIVDVATGAARELTPPHREVTHGSVSADASRVAFTLGGHDTPGALHVLDVASGALTRLFDANEALLAEAALGEVEELWVDSFDGRRVQAWLVKPRDFDPAKQYPLVLQIHGGPHVAYGVGFFHEFRVLAAAGYLVLYTNPRGSTSYGQDFANVIQYHYPGDDYRDLMACVDAVIARGCVDESRMGVTGGSGGGLLTNWVIAQTHRFKAAITQRCVSDWGAMWSTCDFALYTPAWFRAAPWEVPEQYAAVSPGPLMDRIETPLLVLHSEDDWRTPIAQGEIMFRGLKYRKKPVAMVRFPGENHELSRSGTPSRRVQNQQHIRRWFDHWLQDKPAPEYGV